MEKIFKDLKSGDELYILDFDNHLKTAKVEEVDNNIGVGMRVKFSFDSLRDENEKSYGFLVIKNDVISQSNCFYGYRLYSTNIDDIKSEAYLRLKRETHRYDDIIKPLMKIMEK